MMKYILTIGSLFSFAVFSLLADPLIECTAPTHDFGTLVAKENISHEFVLWNRGDSPVKVSEVKGCCGVSATVDTKEIPPGSNAVCKAIFNTRNRHGKQKKTIHITSNAKNHPRLGLNMAGVLLKPVDFSPRIVRFGPSPSGNEVSQFIAVTNLLDAEVTLNSVFTRIKGIEASIKQSKERDWVVELKAVPSLVQGKISGNVQLNFSFGPINIPVIQSTKSIFRVVPRQVIQFPTHATKETVSLVTLLSHDGRPFEISSAKLERVEGAVDIRKHSENRWEFRVRAIPSSIQPNSVLQIRTSSHLQPFVTVPIKRSIP